MQLVLEATYKNGVMVPDRPLGPEKEGKRFRLILVEQEELSLKRDRFFHYSRSNILKLPQDYTQATDVNQPDATRVDDSVVGKYSSRP